MMTCLVSSAWSPLLSVTKCRPELDAEVNVSMRTKRNLRTDQILFFVRGLFLTLQMYVKILIMQIFPDFF